MILILSGKAFFMPWDTLAADDAQFAQQKATI
jgi:hypothetical protein